MDWITGLMNKLKRPPDFIVGGEKDPYLLRWYLLPRNRLCNVYLHKFLRDDDDRAMHDHPWSSLSIVLKGGYFDITPGPDGTEQRVWRGVGSVIFRSAVSRHRVECRRESFCVFDTESWLQGQQAVKEIARPAWTLFITGPRVREWGFWCPRGWVHWRDFTAGTNGEEVGKGCD